MTRARVAASSIIDARPEIVYAIIADYRNGHPRILPHEYFKKLEVEEGGVGAGTRTRFEMRVLGTTKSFHHVVSEPQPGRVLVESDVDGNSATTFTVVPHGGGTEITIETEFQTRGGILGALERFLTAMMMRRIYAKELNNLSAYATTKSAGE